MLWMTSVIFSKMQPIDPLALQNWSHYQLLQLVITMRLDQELEEFGLSPIMFQEDWDTKQDQLCGVASGLIPSSNSQSQLTTPMALSPIQIQNLQEASSIFKLWYNTAMLGKGQCSVRPIILTPSSGKEKVVLRPMPVPLISSICLVCTNVSTDMSPALTISQDPQTLWPMLCLTTSTCLIMLCSHNLNP